MPKVRWRCFSTRSSIYLLMICGVITLFIQVCIYLTILYTSEGDFSWAFRISSSYFTDPIDDLDVIKQVFSDFGLYLAIVDVIFLKQLQNYKSVPRTFHQCHACTFLKYRTLQFAVDKPIQNEVLGLLKKLKFDVIECNNIRPVTPNKDLDFNETLAYVLKRYASYFLVILHRREDNVWWYGNINSDPQVKQKFSTIGVSYSFVDHVPAVRQEGLLNKFETVERELLGTHLDFNFPKNVSQFLTDSHFSRFIECNYERAKTFERVHGHPLTSSAQRFRHKAWKLLSKVKTVFQTLGVDFWLSSGTLLGFVRECDIIAHSKDVDIGVMAESYSEALHEAMTSNGFKLLLRLGKPEDSFELSFTDQSGIKLDIFFFYRNTDGSIWNGGTQVKSGKKFKYTFPPFELCWTLFQGLKVHVPCNTEKYIEANYGPYWFTPVTEWDWKTSPFNVRPNGEWPKEEWPDVIQVTGQ